jgi:hypothetical protein
MRERKRGFARRAASAPRGLARGGRPDPPASVARTLVEAD